MSKGNIQNISVIIKKLQESREKMMAFYSFDHHLLQAEVVLSSYKSDKDSLLFKFDERAAYYLREMISGDNRINLFIPSKSITIITTFKEISTDGILTTSFPQKIIKFDRRNTKRILPNSVIEIKATSKGRSFIERCFDISPRGLSIITANKILSKLPLGSLCTMEISILRTKFIVRAQLIAVNKVEMFTDKNTPYGNQRLAFKFENLNAEGERFLEDFVNGHLAIFRGSVV